MLAYRHIFHAGNFADVFKHALLVRLLIALAEKEKPYCYLDTHAGIGLYDLTPAWAQKLHASQNARHRRQMAIHAIQGGDRGGAGATPDIKERD